MPNFESFLKELVLKFFSMNELPAIIEVVDLLRQAGHFDKLVEAVRAVTPEPVVDAPVELL